MDDILNYLNQMFESKMEHIKANFTLQEQELQTMIKAFAALTHDQPETAIMDIYIFEKDIERETGFIAENIVNGSKNFWDYRKPEQKNRDKQLENEYKELKKSEYLNVYGRNVDKIYNTVINKIFCLAYLTAINEVICTNISVRQQLSLITLNNININELKSVLNDMTEYYASQSTDYKPIKSFINRAWNNENISVAGTGASGAIWGAILGGPVGMVAGAALAGLWADNKKKETYRPMKK